ncbi:HEPN domain protein [Limihaloglobus sulfuriphilus]|uniref:HEPN domain protein n=1 Tax=Limihaloglobus sulfuriphilus TaxID=1851148 RepID=A0A1Q2MBT0_9BACT|nr:HEPN domain-containing protein [Limihaloglobus sulfuriphilus]AQQ70119.1 HEPN domain protein [Limihaloglobus sulfuriphilus]
METFEAAKKWFDKAANDMKAVEIILKAEGEVPYDVVCFHCQQAAEKLLKGYMTNIECEFPFTHNLTMLSGSLARFKGESGIERMFIYFDILEPYSVAARYPGDISVPGREDALEAEMAITEIFNWIEGELPEFF